MVFFYYCVNVRYGSASPQNFVVSQTQLSPDQQNDIGLVVHELLHNLGLGHTQEATCTNRNCLKL